MQNKKVFEGIMHGITCFIFTECFFYFTVDKDLELSRISSMLERSMDQGSSEMGKSKCVGFGP